MFLLNVAKHHDLISVNLLSVAQYFAGIRVDEALVANVTENIAFVSNETAIGGLGNSQSLFA